MSFKRYTVLIIFLVLPFTKVLAEIGLQNPRCEMLENPLGIDAKKPRLSWEITSSETATMQTAYQILVATTAENLASNKGDLWDSGKINSDQSIHVSYAGSDLKSFASCYWKVKVWTNNGQSEWSPPALWTMGLLKSVDWKGRWIGLDRSFPWDNEGQFSRLSARYFRKEFVAKKEIKRAFVYIIGLGLYELYINGKKIGDQVLAPGPTDYNIGVKYNTFEVTSVLKTGANAIGTVLGNGRFYTMRQDYKPYKIKTFGYPKMRLNLQLEYTDGTQETIVTDDSWKVTADGPIRANNEYDGEEYDATKEMTGWNRVGFKDGAWLKAGFVQEAAGMPEAQMNENMKVMETLKPRSVKLLKANVFILDMGQNMAGWLKIKVKGKLKDKVTLRFAESLQADGALFVANLRDAKVTDVYTLKGGAPETWEPSFVYHGFRYVEITGFPGTPTVNDFEGRVVYDEMKTTGTFSTSNRVINQVYKNAYWGIRSNYKGMPVDCPQRNERQPWLGDRSTGAYGESFIFDNGRMYAKWLDDINQSQKSDGSIPDVAPSFWRYYGDNVTWPGTYLAIAEMLYQQYGDLNPIQKHYDSMTKWMDYMKDNYLKDGLMNKDKYGDWCVPPESKELIHSKDPARQTDGILIATATYYRYLGTMQNFAALLNKSEDANVYKTLAETIREAFNVRFLDLKNGQYDNNTVTANLLPVYFNLVPQKERSGILNKITDKILVENGGHISTGLIGTQILMRGLTANGKSDIAYKLATNTSYPSWGYMAEQGATTIWELWNGNTASPKMNSQNHVMLLGDLIIWYYENLAGIKADAPGFKSIIMKPESIAGLDSVNASYQSAYGTIKSYWKRTAGTFAWNLTIPVNTKATVYFPSKDQKSITEENYGVKNLKFLRMEDQSAVYEIGSGVYSFNITKPN